MALRLGPQGSAGNLCFVEICLERGSDPGPVIHWSLQLELGWNLSNACVEKARRILLPSLPDHRVLCAHGAWWC